MHTITSPRCIGYQYDGRGKLRSVFVTHWRDGTTTYNIDWIGEDGYEHSSFHGRTRPHIDVDAMPEPQRGTP